MASTVQRYRARRGKLPRLDRRDAVEDQGEAVFPLGLSSGGGPLAWEPWKTDHPHCLVTGTTGSGKTRKLEEWALDALGWGWRVTVIDAKGGGDFWAALSHGAELVTDPHEGVRTLQEAAVQIKARNQMMLETPVLTPDAQGVMRENRATTYGDLPEDLREPCWLVIADEVASLASVEIKGTPAKPKTKNLPYRPGTPGLSGGAAIATFVQLARSAGIHGVLGMQRPDATLLPGVVKHNVPSRILLGAADKEAEEMVLGSAIIDHPERGLPRPTGTGFAVDIGGRHIVRFHASLLDRSRYLPFAASPEPSSDADAPDPSGTADPAVPEPELPPSATSAPPASSTSSGPGATVTGDRREPVRSGSSSESAAWGRFGRVLRPLVTGPFVRLALRGRALVNLGRPVVAGPFYRDPFLALACKDEADHRCAACGAGEPVEADHDCALMFGGEDAADNLRCLCFRCHRAKTQVEMVIWRARTRGLKGRGLPGGQAFLTAWTLMPVWQKVGAGLLVAGFLTGPMWGGYAVAVLLIAALGPLLLRSMGSHVPIVKHAIRPRGPGIDGINQWDRKLEEDAARPGTLRHAATKGTYNAKQGMFWNRIKLAGMSGAYVAGWQFTAILGLLWAGLRGVVPVV